MLQKEPVYTDAHSAVKHPTREQDQARKDRILFVFSINNTTLAYQGADYKAFVLRGNVEGGCRLLELQMSAEASFNYVLIIYVRQSKGIQMVCVCQQKVISMFGTQDIRNKKP